MAAEGALPVGMKAIYNGRHKVYVLKVRRNDFGALVYLIRGYDQGVFEYEVFADSVKLLPVKV
jgi:hypothetical protein